MKAIKKLRGNTLEVNAARTGKTAGSPFEPMPRPNASFSKEFGMSLLQNDKITQNAPLASRGAEIMYVVISSDSEKSRFSRR